MLLSIIFCFWLELVLAKEWISLYTTYTFIIWIYRSKNQCNYDYVKLYIGYFSNRIPVWERIFTIENLTQIFLKQVHHVHECPTVFNVLR